MSGRILCIIDGMTDESSPKPERLIPFERGCFTTTPAGFEPDSLVCILHLLGLDGGEIPKQARGWVEALGAGLNPDIDDLVFRTSWVKTDKDGLIVSMCPPPVRVKIEGYWQLSGYKGVYIIKDGRRLIGSVTTFAPHRSFGLPIGRCLPSGFEMPQPLAPQNIYLIPWGQSAPLRLRPAARASAAVCGIDLAAGIARAMGYEIIRQKGFTGDTDTDIAGKAKAALDAARSGRFVLLHFNGADEASHRLNPRQKAEFIEKVVSRAALGLLKSDVRCIVTSDHATSAATGLHADAPQPFYCNHIKDYKGKIEGRLAPFI
jgi:2,3-bisphosphoglycerate-independent phosphoglycerate mutase